MSDQDSADPENQEQVCTAIRADGEAPANPLFTPPCTCPRCAPARFYEPRSDDGWLRISGDPRRYRVEPMELGALGRAVLG